MRFASAIATLSRAEFEFTFGLRAGRSGRYAMAGTSLGGGVECAARWRDRLSLSVRCSPRVMVVVDLTTRVVTLRMPDLRNT